MPIIGVALPGGEWRQAQLPLTAQSALKYGDLLGRLVDFSIAATVVFLAVRWVLPKPPKPGEAPATKTCGECLETIPAAAKRCRACTSPQPA